MDYFRQFQLRNVDMDIYIINGMFRSALGAAGVTSFVFKLLCELSEQLLLLNS